MLESLMTLTPLMPFCYAASAPSKIKTHLHRRLMRERKREIWTRGVKVERREFSKKTNCTVLLMKCRSCDFYHKKDKVGEVVTLTSDDISSLVIGCHSTAVCTPVSSTI